jgi:hypothetical protein
MALKIAVLLVLAIVFKIEARTGGCSRSAWRKPASSASCCCPSRSPTRDPNRPCRPTAACCDRALHAADAALFIVYDKLIAPRYDEAQAREQDEIDEASQVIIAGRGRVGGIVDRMLTAAGYKPTVIDFSSKQIDNMKPFGVRTYFGDASRPDLLARSRHR